MRDAISLRALAPDDWEIFRSARLNALKQHREVYLSSYEAEAETPEVKWKETLNGNGKCVVALFDNDRLIGFAAVFTWRGDPTGKSGVLAMDYIEPTYRGRGLSRLLYQGRIDWALDQKQFARLVISHRRETRLPAERTKHSVSNIKTRKDLLTQHGYPAGSADA